MTWHKQIHTFTTCGVTKLCGNTQPCPKLLPISWSTQTMFQCPMSSNKEIKDDLILISIATNHMMWRGSNSLWKKNLPAMQLITPYVTWYLTRVLWHQDKAAMSCLVSLYRNVSQYPELNNWIKRISEKMDLFYSKSICSLLKYLMY